MDQTQAKARELDLVVEKLWPIRGAFGRQQGYVVVRLFVECKFVAAEAVFWFAPKESDAAKRLVCSLGPFREDNEYTFKHHYLAKSRKVAKLFTSSNAKAQENEPFYKALNQALNAMVAMRSQSPSHPSLVHGCHGKVVKLNYPVVVCNSFAQLYEVDFLAESKPTAIQENFQLEVQYAYHDRDGNQRNEYFLLDFVEFDQLAKQTSMRMARRQQRLHRKAECKTMGALLDLGAHGAHIGVREQFRGLMQSVECRHIRL